MLNWWNKLPRIVISLKLLAHHQHRIYLHLSDDGWCLIN